MPLPPPPAGPEVAASTLIFTDPLHYLGAAVALFFIVIGIMLLLDLDIDTKVVAGIMLLLVGLAIAFFLLTWVDLTAILAGLIAALGGKELIEHLGWL